MTTSTQKPKTVLVTGANGYIGQAVARAFQRAGYTTYGLVRSQKSARVLERHLIIPIIGSAADPAAVLSALKPHTTILDVIVSTTEDTGNYVPHFNDTVTLLRMLAEGSVQSGKRPLVLFTSGCKDYGQGELDGSPDLVAHTEESPLNPPPKLAPRAFNSPRILENNDLFDAAVLRPTNVHGHGSSYLGHFFDMAAAAKANGTSLRLETDPRVILHSMHIDDCADAYVALAEHEDRSQIGGQFFNISAGRKYETIKEYAVALANLYQIEKGVEFFPPDPRPIDDPDFLIGFTQWVGSDKLRNLTGWKDWRKMFVEGIGTFKGEYENACKEQDESVDRMKRGLATEKE